MRIEKTISKNQRNSEYLLLVLIILAGAILRFWNFRSMPFMQDELSALSRLQFDNFSDLIRHGVMLGDTHPAGVQVFLYYWTQLFGTSEMVVKLPFIISGILSIWISYKIGKHWFDGTTGLLTAAMIASTQFFVMYSQIARPYVSGLILTLFMVYFWGLYFFKERKILYLILFVLFAAMSAYNHHFSLLFAAVVGVCGVFLLRNRKELIVYAIAGISIFILYIPHLQIFFSQLAHGGVGGEEGWLGKPNASFFFDYLNYLMQFSIWTWLMLLIVVFLLVTIPGKIVLYKNGAVKRWLLFVWFLLPIIIGYTYSVLRNPVIQYSLLLFSTPYIYILVFSVHRKLRIWQKSLLVSLILMINIFVLIYGRDHYKQFYHQPYDVLFTTALLENNPENITILDNCIPYYNNYYFDKYESSPNYFSTRNTDIDILGFKEIVSNITDELVVTQGLTGEELQVVQSYFPFQLDSKKGFTFEIYTFSRNKPDYDFISKEVLATTNFNNEVGLWKDVTEMVVYDSVSDDYQCVMHDNEWGPSVIFNLSKVVPDCLGIVDVDMEMKMDDTIVKSLLIASISKGDETLFWKALNVEEYNPQIGNWFKVYLSIDIQSALSRRKDMTDIKLKVNVWNLNKANIIIRDINVKLKPGNPFRYSLYQPF